MIKASYSFFNELENCPKKAQHVRVLRDLPRQPESPEAAWGNRVHDAMEKRLNHATPLPADVQHFENVAQIFENPRGYAELKVAIKADGTPTQFYAADAMVSGKVDWLLPRELTGIIEITDWKTGKDKYEHPFELELHALMVASALIAQGLDVSKLTFTGRYVYLHKDTYKLSDPYDLSDLTGTWRKVTKFMTQAEAYQAHGGEWPATPNPLCGYCPVMNCRHNKVEQRKARDASK